jgi:hypothetical protein
VTETLLQRILSLVDRIESPTISHAKALGYSAVALAELVSNRVLGQRFQAAKIPRPARFGSGDDLIVRETSCGLFGVVEENDFIEPLPLEEDDRWLYEISLPHIVNAIRKDNGIDGTEFRNDGGLISVGQRAVAGVGIVDVYLSLPNSSEDSVMARCRRLIPIVGERWLALLTPSILDLSREDLGILNSSRIVTISLMAAAGKGHFTVNWDEAFGLAIRGAGALAPAGRTMAVQPDLEQLIEGKQSVRIATAARYLQRTSGHVERLVRAGELKRIGQGRPIQVSTGSLRTRKGTQKEPDS